MKGLDEEERKFKAADVNKDGELDREEYVAFYHPYNYAHMHNIEVERVLREHDKDKDGLLSFKEFIGEGELINSPKIMLILSIIIKIQLKMFVR